MLLRTMLALTLVFSTVAQAAPTAEMKLVEGIVAAQGFKDSQKRAQALLEKYAASGASQDPQATDRYADALEQMGLISPTQNVQYKIKLGGIKTDLASGKMTREQAATQLAGLFTNINGAQFFGCKALRVLGFALFAGGGLATGIGFLIIDTNLAVKGLIATGLGSLISFPLEIIQPKDCGF
jgi:hypothetical protein